MIEKILAAVDPSEHGQCVMEYAAWIGQVFGSEVTGLFVVDFRKIEGPLLRDYLATVGLDPTQDYRTRILSFYERKGKELLDRFAELSAAASLRFRALCTNGIVSDVICREAASRQLVILGRKGEHAEWACDDLGSSVDRVVRLSPAPVLVTPRHFTPISKALVGFDGGPHSRDALSLAAELHRRVRLDVSVLVVAEGSRGEHLVAEANALLGDSAAEIPVRLQPGPEAETILEAADERRCGLIVLGSSGHGKIRSLLVGSTSDQVLRRAAMPVLLTR